MKFRKVNYKDQEIEITFKTDAIFKQLFTTKDSLPFLAFFINSVTGKNYSVYDLKRNEMSGDKWDEKTFYFDIYAKDEEGRDIVIEMQNSIIGKVQEIRFLVYACRVITNKVKKGMDYKDVTPVDMIIITSEKYRNKLHSKATLQFDDGEKMSGNLINLHFISLPMIDQEIVGKEEISNLELLCYVFQNGIDCDIMELANESQKEMVQYMKESYIRLVSDRDVFTQAEFEALKEWEEKAQAKEDEMRRIQLEEQRKKFEEQRKKLEKQSKKLEKQSKKLEEQSKKLEKQRDEAKKQFKESEKKREDAEKQREDAEKQREDAEKQREDAEKRALIAENDSKMKNQRIQSMEEEIRLLKEQLKNRT